MVKQQRSPEKRKLPEWISFKADSRGRRKMFIDDLPVKCGTKAREIEMEDRDIQGANPKDPRNCAFARACRRQFGGEAIVQNHCIYLLLPRSSAWERMGVSEGMRLEAHTLDRGGRVAAGPQRIVPLSPSERRKYEHGSRQGSDAPGARDRGSKDRTPGSTRPLPHYVPDVRHWAAAPKPKKKKVH